MNDFQAYDQRLKQKLRTVSRDKARSYFHKLGYTSSTMLLPEYYKATGFSKMRLEPLTYTAQSKPRRTKPIVLITPKGKMSWRRFSLMHPYAYWHITNELTQSDNWQRILDKLTQRTGVSVYSTPRLDVKQLPQGMGVQSWRRLNDTDLLKDMSGMNYCASSDIKSFYPSIYTHSIAWTLEGKDNSRADREGVALFGNHLDKLFQNAREGQTNGIPIGSILSDVVAELILNEIDARLTEKAEQRGLSVISARYRDDYRFLCRTRSEAEEMLKILSRILQTDFDLSMNDDKTTVDDDAILSSLRPWEQEFKHSILLSKVFDHRYREFTGRELRNILLAAYDLQARYPYSRSGIQILHRLSKKLAKNEQLRLKLTDVEVIIPLTRKLILLREDVTPTAMLFLDRILDFVPSKRCAELIKEMYERYMRGVDNEYQEVWLYRVCLHHAPGVVKSLFKDCKNPLIMMLNNGSEPHYTYFGEVDAFIDSDRTELEKFSLVDAKLLTKASARPITPESINIFPRYPSAQS